ncbi:MAG: DNA topoisomerase I [Thaumarchaeota archaeon]|nr:DNA topoisomerase I [Nitrososphaerota archaeon]
MNWNSLYHNGIAFPIPYKPIGMTIKIRSEKVRLNPSSEEMVYAWAKKKDTAYVQDAVFVENFLTDLREHLPQKYQSSSIDDFDFSDVYRSVDEEKAMRSQPDIKKNLAQDRKRAREELRSRFGLAEMDGKQVEVANWMAEPPGFFLGRGEHPFRGKWKPRIVPQDITLNLSKDAIIPEGQWGGIVHDHKSMWLARWIDRLTKKEKYVWLSDSASIKQVREKSKYDLALRLEKQIGKIRIKIMRSLHSRDPKAKKVAMVCYLLDALAMRVGDEKDEDEADTVGASTLRFEHIKLTPNRIEFDFLGKDSVRWQKSLELKVIDPEVPRYLSKLLSGKKEGDAVFDGIDSRHVNRLLGRAMKGLTAKVFRTYVATNIVRNYLHMNELEKEGVSDSLKLYHAKIANLQAAVICNHKRSPPKNWENTIIKKEETLARLENSKPKTDKQAIKLEERREKAKLALDLARRTKDYNLSTSLRNYIDPRLFKSWSEENTMDWSKIYTAALQKKFRWVNRSRADWS